MFGQWRVLTIQVGYGGGVALINWSAGLNARPGVDMEEAGDIMGVLEGCGGIVEDRWDEEGRAGVGRDEYI